MHYRPKNNEHRFSLHKLISCHLLCFFAQGDTVYIDQTIDLSTLGEDTMTNQTNVITPVDVRIWISNTNSKLLGRASITFSNSLTITGWPIFADDKRRSGISIGMPTYQDLEGRYIKAVEINYSEQAGKDFKNLVDSSVEREWAVVNDQAKRQYEDIDNGMPF